MSSTFASTIPPPPPFKTIRHFSLPATKTKIDGCLWAKDFPDIQQGCYLSQICTINPPKACAFKNISSIIQQGPTCGLTCISMLTNGSTSPKELLEIAKNYQYTLNGEMFSAKNLCDILEKVIIKENSNMQCQIYQGPLNCAKVKDLIINGACLFVPYPF